MLKRLLANDFNQNVIKLLTGATIAQAIPIAISPILTRLYTPEDFGVLALFIAITSILGSIVNARYELAIVLPEKEEDSINIAALSLMIATIISLMLLVVIIIFHEGIINLLSSKELGVWLYFIPLVVFFLGIFNTLNFLNTRMKTFGVIAQVRVIKAITMSIVQLTMGLFKVGVGGLISGQIVSHIFSNGKLAFTLFKNKELIQKINLHEMKKQAKRYNRFPKFTLWATLSNSLSLQAINIFISTMYSTVTLGFYALIQRILGMPATLISSSIAQVYFQKASEERNKYGNARSIYISTFLKLFMIGLIFFGALYFTVENLVTFVFGEEWEIAGLYAKYLIPLIFIRFIASPLTLTNIVFEKQNIDFIWQLILLTLSLLVFTISYIYKLNITTFFLVNTIVISAHYLIIICITYYVSKGEKNKN